MKKAILSVLFAAILALSVIPVTAAAAPAAEESVHACTSKTDLSDHGPNPYAAKLARLACKNPNYRTTVWSGGLLQLTVMCIPKKGEIGLEVHPDTDQFLYVVEGSGTVLMGPEKGKLNYTMPVEKGSGIFVPYGMWHNVVNKGSGDLKLFTVYAPPHHPHGTVHKTKAIADAAGD